MADDKVRDEQGMASEKSEAAESRRNLIKGAAALAAAAVGGGLVAGAADAQVGQIKPQLQTGTQMVRLQPSGLAKSLKVSQLGAPLANLPALNPAVNKADLQRVLGDIDRFIQPILDRNGGQVSDVNITVEGSVTVSG
jgi:hypothetical protein